MCTLLMLDLMHNTSSVQHALALKRAVGISHNRYSDVVHPFSLQSVARSKLSYFVPILILISQFPLLNHFQKSFFLWYFADGHGSLI